MKSEPFRLVPLVGELPEDVLRDFDGQGERLRADARACHGSLRTAIREFDVRPSVYETAADPEASCQAALAAAREAQKVGLAEVAAMLTEPSVRHRRALEAHLTEQLIPAGPAPGPGMGPRFGA